MSHGRRSWAWFVGVAVGACSNASEEPPGVSRAALAPSTWSETEIPLPPLGNAWADGSAAAAWDGTNYVVAWIQRGSMKSRVRAARLTRALVPVDAPAAVLAEAPDGADAAFINPRVVCRTDGNCAIGWSRPDWFNTGSRFQRLWRPGAVLGPTTNVDGDLMTAGPDGFLLLYAPNVVVGGQFHHSLEAAILELDGDVRTKTLLPLAEREPPSPNAFWTGTEYLITSRGEASFTTEVRRYDSQLEPTAPSPLLLNLGGVSRIQGDGAGNVGFLGGVDGGSSVNLGFQLLTSSLQVAPAEGAPLVCEQELMGHAKGGFVVYCVERNSRTIRRRYRYDNTGKWAQNNVKIDLLRQLSLVTDGTSGLLLNDVDAFALTSVGALPAGAVPIAGGLVESTAKDVFVAAHPGGYTVAWNQTTVDRKGRGRFVRSTSSGQVLDAAPVVVDPNTSKLITSLAASSLATVVASGYSSSESDTIRFNGSVRTIELGGDRSTGMFVVGGRDGFLSVTTKTVSSGYYAYDTDVYLTRRNLAGEPLHEATHVCHQHVVISDAPDAPPVTGGCSGGLVYSSGPNYLLGGWSGYWTLVKPDDTLIPLSGYPAGSSSVWVYGANGRFEVVLDGNEFQRGVIDDDGSMGPLQLMTLPLDYPSAFYRFSSFGSQSTIIYNTAGKTHLAELNGLTYLPPDQLANRHLFFASVAGNTPGAFVGALTEETDSFVQSPKAFLFRQSVPPGGLCHVDSQCGSGSCVSGSCESGSLGEGGGGGEGGASTSPFGGTGTTSGGSVGATSGVAGGGAGGVAGASTEGGAGTGAVAAGGEGAGGEQLPQGGEPPGSAGQPPKQDGGSPGAGTSGGIGTAGEEPSRGGGKPSGGGETPGGAGSGANGTDSSPGCECTSAGQPRGPGRGAALLAAGAVFAFARRRRNR